MSTTKQKQKYSPRVTRNRNFAFKWLPMILAGAVFAIIEMHVREVTITGAGVVSMILLVWGVFGMVLNYENN